MSELAEETLYEAVGLLRVLARDQLEDLRREMDDEELAGGVLSATSEGWITSGELMVALGAKTSAEKKRVQRKCVELVERGLLLGRGTGSGKRYRSTGVL